MRGLVSRKAKKPTGWQVLPAGPRESPGVPSDVTFAVGEKVRIKPGEHFPCDKKAVRYGMVAARARCAGIYLADLARESKSDEPSYAVVRWGTRGNGGFSWFSSAAIEKMKWSKL